MLSSEPASIDTNIALVGPVNEVSKTFIQAEDNQDENGVVAREEEMFNSLQSLVDLANSDRSESTTSSSESRVIENANSPNSAMCSSGSTTNAPPPSDLVREANEKIRFSIHFDARKNQQQNSISSANKILNVKEDLHKVKQDISELKNDLKSAEQPLMVTIFWIFPPLFSAVYL